MWWAGRDSNPRPPPCEGGLWLQERPYQARLPAHLAPEILSMVRVSGPISLIKRTMAAKLSRFMSYNFRFRSGRVFIFLDEIKPRRIKEVHNLSDQPGLRPSLDGYDDLGTPPQQLCLWPG